MDVVLDVAVEGAQGLAEFGWGLRLVGGGERDEQPVVDFGVEDRDADAVAGECVAVGVGCPGD